MMIVACVGLISNIMMLLILGHGHSHEGGSHDHGGHGHNIHDHDKHGHGHDELDHTERDDHNKKLNKGCFEILAA